MAACRCCMEFSLKMRILQFYKDYAPVMGGIENHMRVLAEGLHQAGHTVRVLVTSPDRHSTHTQIGGVDVYKTARWLAISSAPISGPFYPTLRRLEADSDIAHAHAPYPPGELGHLLLGQSRAFVMTYHSDIVRQRVLGFFYSPFLRRVLQLADGILVSNPMYIQDSPFLAACAEKCRVVPFGIDLARFDLTEPRAQAVAELRTRFASRPLLLFVGQFRHYKGVDVLLQAMAQIDAELLIVGQGPLGDEWRRLAQTLGVGERVHFLGPVSDEELVNLYHAAQVFVLPSTNRAETLGIVQIEAMACHTPLVCTELGTGTSFVNRHGETGFVVPPHAPDALAQAINQILADPTLQQSMGKAGRERAETVFSAPGMIGQTAAFYREILEKKLSRQSADGKQNKR